MKQFLEDVRFMSEAMGKTKVHAVYTTPNFMLSKHFGGKKGLVGEIHRMFPYMKPKFEWLKKGKLSTDVRISNITANDAIMLTSYFVIRGGTLKMAQ